MAKAAGPAPTKSNVSAGNNSTSNNDSHWYNFFNDHNPGGDFLYELNKFNPLSNVVNAVDTYISGHDTYGVKQSKGQATVQLASALPVGSVGSALMAGEELIADGASSLFSYIDSKIAGQMARRGWTTELIHYVVNNPFAMRIAKNRATGNPATAFFTVEGYYVVKDNITNKIIRISDRLDPRWVPDGTIILPYIGK